MILFHPFSSLAYSQTTSNNHPQSLLAAKKHSAYLGPCKITHASRNLHASVCPKVIDAMKALSISVQNSNPHGLCCWMLLIYWSNLIYKNCDSEAKHVPVKVTIRSHVGSWQCQAPCQVESWRLPRDAEFIRIHQTSRCVMLLPWFLGISVL